jgi:hypothetical protein
MNGECKNKIIIALRAFQRHNDCNNPSMKQLTILLLAFMISAIGNGQTPHVIDSLNVPKQAIDTTFFRPYALIAGGSKGIGYALAEAWANVTIILYLSQDIGIVLKQQNINWNQLMVFMLNYFLMI